MTKLNKTPTNRVARAISLVLHPLFFGLPVILWLSAVENEPFDLNFIKATAQMVMILTILPALFSTLLMKMGVTESFFITRRRHRIYFFPFLLVCVVFAVAVMRLYGYPERILNLFIAVWVVFLFSGFVTIRHKLSLHCVGIAALAAGSIAIAGPRGFVVLAFLPVVAWARVAAGEHTTREVAVGSAIGFGLTYMAMRLVLQ